MSSLLAIEVKKAGDGYQASVIDLSDDSVLHVTESKPDASAAVSAASEWIGDHR